MNVRDVLVAARALIEPREAWIKGDEGRDATGRCVPAHDPAATCRCMMGAARAASPGGRIRDVPMAVERSLHRALLPVAFWSSVYQFNDHHRTTHADVLAAFDRAIAACDTGGAS